MHELIPNAIIQPNANRVARLLDEAGVAQGQVVNVLMPNCPEFVFTYRAIGFSGRILTPISTHLPRRDVRYIAENSGARALITHADYRESALAVADRFPGSARFAVGGDIPGFRSFDEYQRFSDEPLEQPTAGDVMLYTSGTTGRPKGVYRPTNIGGEPPSIVGASGKAMMAYFLGDKARGRHLVVTPLYHAAASTYAEGAALCGADLVLMERFEPEAFLRLIEEYRIVSTFLVPTLFVRLLRLPEAVRNRYDLSSLQLVCHGAAPVSIPVKCSMIEWLGPILFESYGGTEGGGIHISSQEWLEHPGAVGKPDPALEVRILDDRGEELPMGSAGLIYMNATAPFEYRSDPEKTARAWRGKQFTLGDIGYLDDEGYLYLCDRRSDLIISGGVNVYPAEVESVLMREPAVEECCVIGLPDEEWGERVCAVIRPARENSGDLIGDLNMLCSQELAPWQRPREYIIDDSLQRTATGKLSRRAVLEKHLGGPQP